MGGWIKKRNIHSSLQNWLRAQNVGFGMQVGSRAWFVDRVNGSDNYAGRDDPASAFATLEKALENANAYDVVYVADPGTSSSDPLTYSGAAANFTVPVASKGLAIVGIAHSGIMGNGRPISPSLYAYQAATPLMTVNAPLVSIENFRLCGVWDAAGVETAGIAVADFSEGVAEGFGLSVHNCYFEDLASVGDLGAIAITGQWNATITQCLFMNCEVGISVVSSGSTTVGTVIEDMKFMSRDGLGTKIVCDIYIYCQGSSGIMIDKVVIAHDVPIASGNKGACIAAVGGAETGFISHVFAMDRDGNIHTSTGTIVRVPNTMGTAFIYDGTGALQADEG